MNATGDATKWRGEGRGLGRKDRERGSYFGVRSF